MFYSMHAMCLTYTLKRIDFIAIVIFDKDQGALSQNSD